jgi:hypothetical protein
MDQSVNQSISLSINQSINLSIFGSNQNEKRVLDDGSIKSVGLVFENDGIYIIILRPE